MHTCYATSNRGRGDHTYAWTVQAEEGASARTPATSPRWSPAGSGARPWSTPSGCATSSPTTPALETFRDLLYAITGIRYSAEELIACGRRIVNLERDLLNGIQGRTRAYDAYIPPQADGADVASAR